MIHGVRLEQIEKELAMAEAALREANEGKARVCARRAVALAAEASLERFRGLVGAETPCITYDRFNRRNPFPYPSVRLPSDSAQRSRNGTPRRLSPTRSRMPS